MISPVTGRVLLRPAMAMNRGQDSGKTMAVCCEGGQTVEKDVLQRVALLEQVLPETRDMLHPIQTLLVAQNRIFELEEAAANGENAQRKISMMCGVGPFGRLIDGGRTKSRGCIPGPRS